MFGERLKFALSDNGITQIELAKKLNMSQQAVNRWCQNITQPDSETLVKIAKYLHVSTDFLFGKDEDLSKKDEELYEKLALKKMLTTAGYMKENEDLSNNELKTLLKFVEANKDFIKKI